MSRKTVVLISGGLFLLLIVAIVKAQEPFRRADHSTDRESATSIAKTSGLTERLQAVRRSSEFQDDQVMPAAGEEAPRSSRRPGVIERRVAGSRAAQGDSESFEPDAPLAFGPEAVSNSQDAPKGKAASDDDAAESLPSVLKRGAPSRSTAGGEFTAPKPKSSGAHLAPVVTPSQMDAPRSDEGGASSRRTVKAPQSSVLAGRPSASRGDRQSEKSTLSSGHSPALRIDAVGPAAIKIGKEAIFTVQAVNESSAEAHDVAVTIDLPAWVQATGSEASSGAARRKGTGEGTQLVWEIGRLAGHGQEQLQLKLSPQESRQFELAIDWTCSHARAVARVAVQEPQLSMTLTGPKEMQYGQAAVYTITLTNPGTGDAENVTVSLLPPAGSTRNKETNRVGAVPAGQQKQLEIELTAREAGTMEVHLSAEADGGLHGEAVASVLVRRAMLEVAFDGPKLKFAGSSGVYQVRVANTGNAPADDVMAHVTLPAGAKYLGGIDKAKPTSGGISWPVGKLAPGAERVVELKCELTTGGDNKFDAKVKGHGDLAASGDFVTQVEALADLKLTVVEPKGPRAIGEDTVYEVHIANRGSKAARQVHAVVQFADGIEPTAAEGARFDLVPGQVVFHPLSRVDAGEEIVLRITAKAEKQGSHIFRTEIKCADPETRLVFEGTTRFFASEGTSRTATGSAKTPAKKATRPDTLQLR